MAKELLDAGIGDIVLLERSDGVGGTWYTNRYPGCACDIQSALYSFSWEVKPDWSRPYATQPEILAYLQGIAERYGILPLCRFGTEVVRATWDGPSATWRLETADGGVVEANVMVSAVGMFRDPTPPDIEGIGSFGGTIFHSAAWEVDHDLTGEAVGVIGSAASAVQLVPEIARVAGRVHLFQRTANWVLPKPDTPYTEEQLHHFRAHPEVVAAMRAEIRRHLDAGMTFADPVALAEREAAGLAAIDEVEDPEVRRALRPQHPFGCKRPLFSNDYYAAFNRDNVELVTEPIARITPDAVVTGDGTHRAVDTLILATGYATTKYVSVIDVVGRGGRRIADDWIDGAQAYLGMAAPGYPNLFLLYGPNTNNGSILTMIESQVAHIVRQVERLRDEGLAWVDVRPEPTAAYNEDVQRAIAGVAVWQADCHGYYRSRTGRIVTQWPFSMSEFDRRTATIERDHFEVAPR
jgi:cation diffusion facilitator CzcD-associated flavoprotein CzcO